MLPDISVFLFQSRTEVLRDAETTVDRFLARVEDARKSGALTQVNAAYEAYRQEQLSRNEAALSYTAHLANFTREFVIPAAQNANKI